jgi:uncharacterized protein (TIGR02466 family)
MDTGKRLEQIFATPILLAQRPDSSFTDSVIEQEQEFIQAAAGAIMPNTGGNGSSTDTEVLNSLPALKGWIEHELTEYWKTTVTSSGQATPKITQSWLNFTTTGQGHHAHWHTNSIVSGVYYPLADHTTDTITFERPKQSAIEFHQWGHNEWTTPAIHYSVASGQLILFPSSVVHWVNTVTKPNHQRVSLSFNVWFEGHLGNKENKNYL